MIRGIASALNRWKDDESIHCVVFQGAGDRAFCAGGDIRSFYNSGMDYRRGLVSARVPVVFFAEEYSLNKQIFYYEKPTIAIMDGYTMGGGYGIAGHCDIRVATEHTVFAMPESGIGFFPDVGSLYHLHRCPRHYGRYLALTGQGIDGDTAYSAGLVDIMVNRSDVPDLINALVGLEDDGEIKTALADRFAQKQPSVIEHSDEIEAVFESFDIKTILERLEAEDDAFFDKVKTVLLQRSPISIAVTASYLKRSENQSFDDIIATDFVLVQNFIKQHDMYEGIRAQIIDKDKEPSWVPDCFDAISEDDVNAYFTPTGYDLKDVEIF